MRSQVAIAKASGLADDKIALAIGVSRTTLLKHFAAELDVGAARKRMDWASAMHKAGMKGNVAALKWLMANAERADADKAFEAATGTSTSEPIGKKEAARIAADGAENGTEWSGLLPN